MINIIVELWPHGDQSKKRELASAYIANDGTGTLSSGNYKVNLYGAKGVFMRRIVVTGFPRKRKHVWALLKRVLEQYDE